MSIRAATAGDVAAVTALEVDLFSVDAWSAAAVTEELTGPRRRAVVAELDAEPDRAVVGYAVTALAGDVVDLQRIGVAPAHRRTGVASGLLAAVRAAGQEQGASRMLLEVASGNAAALAFYRDQGFTEIDRRARYYRDGSDALVLALDLGEGPPGGRP